MESRFEPASFEWDDAKAASNEDKHGVDFDMAALVFTDEARLEAQDVRQSYGEDRFNVIGCIEGFCFHVTFTPRNGAARIISARLASREERDRYGNRS